MCAILSMCASLTSIELSHDVGGRANIRELLAALPSCVNERDNGHHDISVRPRAGSTLHSPFADSHQHTRAHNTSVGIEGSIELVRLAPALSEPAPGSHRLRVLRLSAIAHLTDAVLIDVLRHACPTLIELCVDQCTLLTDLSLQAVPHTLRVLSICLNSNVSDAGVTAACAAATELEDVNVSFCFRLTDAVLRTAFARLPRLHRLNVAHVELLTNLTPLHALLSGQPPMAEYQHVSASRDSRTLAAASSSGNSSLYGGTNSGGQFATHHHHTHASAGAHGSGLMHLNISGCHSLPDAALLGVGRAIGARAGVQVVVLNAGVGIDAVAAARAECPNSVIFHA